MGAQTFEIAMSNHADPAPLHADGTAVWDIAPGVAAFLKAHVKPGMRTIETGAGRSTLMFVEAGAVHTVVTPSSDEQARILAEARRLKLDTSALTFAIGYSQDVLPKLEGALDFALIDGGHGFPIPAVDYAYIAPRLVVGGLLLIDDIDLWTGAMLVDFLKHEADWAFETILHGRTAVFRVLRPPQLREWTEQPYVAARSRWPQRLRKAGNVLTHVVRGEFGALTAKFKRDLSGKGV